MSEVSTIARPYAKAFFQYAFETSQLVAWSKVLQTLAVIVQVPTAIQFLDNPATTTDLQSKFLKGMMAIHDSEIKPQIIENSIALLVENKRLAALPEIAIQYETLRAEAEKTLTVYVSSFLPLNTTEQERLMTSLSKRLQRHVSLEVALDEALLGGAVIRAGDLVIDGSVRGKLNKLCASLAA